MQATGVLEVLRKEEARAPLCRSRKDGTLCYSIVPHSYETFTGCPRILSSDTATDFATLLKMIYLPGYAILSL